MGKASKQHKLSLIVYDLIFLCSSNTMESIVYVVAANIVCILLLLLPSNSADTIVDVTS